MKKTTIIMKETTMRLLLLTLGTLLLAVAACKTPTEVDADRQVTGVTTTNPAALIVEGGQLGPVPVKDRRRFDIILRNTSDKELLRINTLRIQDSTGSFTLVSTINPVTLDLAGAAHCTLPVSCEFVSNTIGAFAAKVIVNEAVHTSLTIAAVAVGSAIDTVLPTPSNPIVLPVPGQPVIYRGLVIGETYAHTFILKNNDADSYLHIQPSVTGADATSFVVYPDSITGATDYFLAPAGQSGSECTVKIGFSPLAVGWHQAELQLGGTATNVMTLRGRGYSGRVLLVVPKAQSIAVGQTLDIPLEIWNLSQSTATVSNIGGQHVQSVPANLMRVDNVNLPLMLAPAQKCAFLYRYSPTATGGDTLRFDATVFVDPAVLDDVYDKVVRVTITP
ncbi:MAG: hypothetical protein HY962_05670 [Ignavibacteriae bacterium]|nr:hypothetical protein [Ignavibacteriota bacterium]